MKHLFLFLVPLFFLACSTVQGPVLEKKRQEALSLLLLNLSFYVDKNEAQQLATIALEYSQQLAINYDLATPPLYHNFLVNIGAKKRGLCWHFAYDMLERSLVQKLQSFDYYIGGANINEYWSEHNTLVVTCKGCRFDEGIVLDPWRNSGTLFYAKLKDDKQYVWVQRGDLRK